MNKLREKAFFVVCDKSWYEGFIPFYIYFCNRACPDADIFVYFRGIVEKDTKKILKILGCFNYFIIEKWRLEYDNSSFTTKTLRWLINDDNIKKYNYAYIGDIDILLNKEAPDLFKQHDDHLNLLNLPFSNIIRDNSKRMSGLHFIKVREYFEKTDNIINEFLFKFESFKKDKEGNEGVLYKMLEEAGFIEKLLYLYNKDKRKFIFRPHHGVHLGCFRFKKHLYDSKNNNYFKDFLKAFNENKKLHTAIQMSNDKIKKCFKKCFIYPKCLGIIK